jgi:dTDP-4-amino-4,6-dideoxygalactose transaminase
VDLTLFPIPRELCLTSISKVTDRRARTNMSTLAILGGSPTRKKPFPPWPQFRASDVSRLVGVVESRHWGGFPVPSKYSAEFANRFAELHGAKYGLCLANGTVALFAALQALGLKFRDEVIVPAYTWDGTAVAVLQAGGVPVFVDVDPDTYCLDPKAVRAALTSRTRAILPVHLALRFADMNALRAVAHEHNLLIVEDCAHAHGGQFQGRGAGAGGDAGCFSFQESKLMTAGEGGIVLTNRLDCYEALQSAINCGRPSLTDKFERKVLGANYRMTELQASLLIGQLDMWPEFQARRVRHAQLLTSALSALPHVRPLPPQPELTRETLYQFVFQYRPEIPGPSRDLFVAALEAEGIPCDGRFYEPVYRSDLFCATPENCPQLVVGREQPMDYSQCSCPVSERAAYDESVWLPHFVLLGEETDALDVARAIEKVVSHIGDLAKADPKLAGLKACSRGLRAKMERLKNY